MNAVNKLGIRVAILTIIGLVIVYGVYWGVRKSISSFYPSVSLSPSLEPTLEPIVDRDQDGLSDLVENVYQSNPDNPDTDGDGTKDGAEVIAGRDPLQVGPNDLLGDVPLASQVTDTSTYTGQYLATLPADLNRNDILDKTRVEAFIAEHRGKLLPDLPEGTIKVSTETGAEAVKKYLDQISSSTNPAIKPVSSTTIDAAFRASYEDPKNPALEEVERAVAGNFTILAAVETPKETLLLHTKLVAATKALANNIALLKHMPTDLIGGQIGAKNIEDLGPVFQDIAKQVQQLEG